MLRLTIGNLFLLAAMVLVVYGLLHVYWDGIDVAKNWLIVAGGFFAGIIGYNMLSLSNPNEQ